MAYLEDRMCMLWYRASELVMGYRTYGPTVDVWVLIYVMVELLTGTPMSGGAEDDDDMYVMVLDLLMEMTSTECKAFEDLPIEIKSCNPFMSPILFV
jgi:hypothetical protein